jgi:hypothetical protein
MGWVLPNKKGRVVAKTSNLDTAKDPPGSTPHQLDIGPARSIPTDWLIADN